MTYECILVETDGAIGIIRLNRPKALNALNNQMVSELNQALDHFESESNIGAIILTGSEKAFAAGADIREMKDLTSQACCDGKFLDNWNRINTITKPIIAAVAGFALGGGCEFALSCDTIIAADTAKFALPEVTLGIIPGLGGTQRLTHAVGKAKAMEMILSGRMIDAGEAERAGFVARVVAAEKLMEEALTLARKIASLSQPAIAAAKRAVKAAEELPLQQGVRFERETFYDCFDLEDQKEGMTAFLEKRPAQFKNK